MQENGFWITPSTMTSRLYNSTLSLQRYTNHHIQVCELYECADNEHGEFICCVHGDTFFLLNSRYNANGPSIYYIFQIGKKRGICDVIFCRLAANME